MGDTRNADGLAIVGIAGRLPGADDVFAFWRNLLGEVESIARLPEQPPEARTPASGHHVPAKGVLADADRFDPAFFGFSPRAAALLDPQQRLFLECAWQALEDAGSWCEAEGERIGVFAGVSTVSSYYHRHLLANAAETADDDPFQMMLSNQPSGVANLVSYRLNLTGPSLAVHTACSTGLVAVALACTHLLDGQCDAAVAGAASLSLPLQGGYWHAPGGILSPDGHCRAFAADAQGTVPGNGVAAVVLRRLDDALARGDHIYAVVRGYAVNNDGADKVGYTAPGISGQAQVIADALAMAGCAAEAVTYVETHGTGTPLGDAIELEALGRALRGGPAGDVPCLLGALKPSIGHLDTAAGIASLVKLALMLDRRMLPASLHASPPSPYLAGTPFAVNGHSRPWPVAARPRMAGVSSFGMGGTNAHLVLEELPAPTPDADETPSAPVLLALSGHTAAAMVRFGHRLADHLAATPDLRLADMAVTLGLARRAHRFRRGVVACDREQAMTLLRAVGPGNPVASTARDGVVFLFPGQGAQIPGVARRLAASEPAFAAALADCLDRLRPQGVELARLLLGDDAEDAARRLQDTALAQPAMFAVSYALARLLASWRIEPAAMLGHSVGEYAAACLAGVLRLDDVLRLVVARGRLIQALPRGRMLAVGLSREAILPWLARYPALSLAACNAAEATVLAGPAEAIDACCRALETTGAACRVLATSHAFHSAMMDPALPAFHEIVAEMPLRAPHLPYVSALTGTWITDEQAVDPGGYVRHLRQPVLFGDGVRTLLEAGYGRFVEVGPGSTLARLTRRQATPERPVTAVPLLPDADPAGPRAAIGALWADGLTLDWRALEPQARRVPLPPYPFERQRCWIDSPEDRGQASAPAPAPPPAVVAPAGDAEAFVHVIAEIWQRQLGVAGITADSDFHEHGGDSLLAVQVAALINRRLGTHLPPHALVEAPTPRALAAWIATAQQGAAGSASPRPFALVTLRTGQADRLPLFLTHAVGGTVHFYGDLAAALDPDLPLHALQAPALDGGTPTDRDVGALAGRCLAALRWQQPRGPYRLVGASFGGMLAYEMARQLDVAGERVELLALLDTPAMEELPPVLAERADIVSYVAALLGFSLPADGLRQLDPLAQAERLIACCGTALPSGMTAADLELHLQVFEANTVAMRAYRIEPCRQPDEILYFRARERDDRTARHPERPWRARLGPRLRLVEVAGGHLTMMQRPQVAEIAAVLDAALKRPPIAA